MGQLKIDRRGFIASALAGGAGLLVGVSIPSARASEPSSTFAPNAFLRITTDGQVTLALPKTEMGQGVFTALTMIVAEELEADPATIVVEIPKGANGRFGKVRQSTGGSTSIRECWLPMRSAGAAARSLLIEAAAQTWGVSKESCIARLGRVEHPASGRALAYGDLAAAASRLPAPEAPELKTPSEFRLIGRTVRRLDAPGKVDGSAVYGIDVKLRGLKVAMIAICPVVGGTLAGADEAAALATPGVRHVVRLRDALAVVADHTWAARKGLEAAAPRWDEGPNAGLSQAKIIADLEAAAARSGAEAARRGDIERAMASAQRHIEAVYHQPFLAHAPMEPMNCTVHVRPDGCDLWLGTQVPEKARDVAARAARLPVDKVTVHNFLMGGGFGRRLETDMVERAVEIGKAAPYPVKVIWSREEDIQHDLFRPYYVDRISAGLDDAGFPVAWTHRIAGSSIIARLYPQVFKGVDSDAVEGAVKTAYRLPNTLVEFVQQESPVTTSWWRGVGPLRSTFVVESFVDELAHAAGMDPLEYRLRLTDDARAQAVLRAAAARAGWSAPVGKGVGRGVALLSAWDTYMAQVVEVEVGEDLSPVVRKVTAVVDCGQVINPDGVRAQVEGGIIFGLSAALWGEITVAAGRVEQSNFHDYRAMRINEAPKIDVHILESQAKPGGMGEPPTATVFPALANAVCAATGVRVRTLPVERALQAKRA